MDTQQFIEGFEQYLQQEHVAFDSFEPGEASEIYHALQSYCELKKIDIIINN